MSWSFYEVADFNGDGKTDILFRREVSFQPRPGTPFEVIGTEFAVWLMDGTTPIAQQTIGNILEGQNWSVDVLGDYNGDGKTDLMFRRTTVPFGFEYNLWQMDGVNPPVQSRFGIDTLGSTQFFVYDKGDFNGNGRDEVLLRRSGTGGVNYYLGFFVQNSANLSALIPLPRSQGFPDVADFNGDGKDDLIFTRTVFNGSSSTLEYDIWLMDGTRRTSQASGTIRGGWTLFGGGDFGDFNGDGKDDLLFYRTTNTGFETAIWLMDGLNPTTQASLGNTGEWAIDGKGDFNGDGKTDLVFSRNVAGGREYGIWLMDGITPIAKQSLGIAGEQWFLGAIGDFDGDGKDDLLFHNFGTSSLGLWLMDGVTPISQQVIGKY
jgi:hypothetical protein